MKKLLALMAVSSLVGLSACVADTSEQGDDEAMEQADNAGTVDKAIMPTADSLVHNQAGKPSTGAGISYHSGPVMVNGVTMYYIWYGDWSGSSAAPNSNAAAKTIMTDFAQNIGNSPYWNINHTTYYNGSNQYVSSTVNYGGATSVAYPYGTSLSDAQIQQVVSDAINTGALPKSTDAIYFVITSSDVTASSGFCTQYCGWHTHGTIGGSDIKYSFIGDPNRCLSSCSMQQAPNGNVGADGAVSIIAHELEEAASDPDLNAWYDNRGYENADKCAWTFGTTYKSNGQDANMKLGTRDFLIQQNWKVAGGTGACALQ